MKKIIITLLAALALGSCDDRFERFQQNPNQPQTAPPVNILHGIVMDSWEMPWDGVAVCAQYWVASHPTFITYAFPSKDSKVNYYDQLRNIDMMFREIDSQQNPQDYDAYRAVGKFFQAMFYVRMTERLGDIAMTEAMAGDEGYFTPAYESQKDVYINCLGLLDQANTEIAAAISGGKVLAADLFYEGDLAKWQKAINSFRLRVLMSLSKRTADIDVVEQFNAIVGNPAKYPIMTSADDNMQIVYYGSTNDRYPMSLTSNQWRRPLGETYVALLRETRDPRIFKQMVPGDNAPEPVPTAFDAYKGALNDETAGTSEGESRGTYAMIAEIYKDPVALPTVQLGYPEVEFILAEAINRGWTNGDAAEHYEAGVTADMEFYKVVRADIDDFLSRNAYPGDNADGLTRILEQKYVAFFQNSGWQPFMEQRRTGVPEFHVGTNIPNSVLRIPVRFQYPENELVYNEANLKAALQSQFGGSDTINDVMWLIK